MKKILKIIQSVCLVAIIYMHKSSIADTIIAAVLAIVLGACAYAEGLFHE